MVYKFYYLKKNLNTTGNVNTITNTWTYFVIYCQLLLKKIIKTQIKFNLNILRISQTIKIHPLKGRHDVELEKSTQYFTHAREFTHAHIHTHIHIHIHTHFMKPWQKKKNEKTTTNQFIWIKQTNFELFLKTRKLFTNVLIFYVTPFYLIIVLKI